MSKGYTDADVQAAWDALRSDDSMDYLKPAAVIRAVLDAVAPAVEARAQAQVLREAADKTIAETVCCDEYEAFKAGVARPKYPHHICYWGAAHAEALRERATEIEDAHRG